MKPNAVALKREKLFMDHVFKCFTFGKPVRRDSPVEKEEAMTKAEELKGLFSRVKLIRKNFAVSKMHVKRKFAHPVDQMGKILDKKA